MNKLTWLNFIGVILCIVFFVVAFWITRTDEKYQVPILNVTVASNVDAETITNDVRFCESYQEKLKTILQDRESIVNGEHEKFRAELGTWLSIFGLLAILATIMVAALSYTCQQSSIKDERDRLLIEFDGLQENFETYKESLSGQFKRFKDDMADLATQHVDKIDNEGAVAESENIVKNLNENDDEGNRVDLDYGIENEFMNVQDECKRFVRLWPPASVSTKSAVERFSDKIDAGIKCLRRYDSLLLKCKELRVPSIKIKKIVCKMHLIKIYLGQNVRSDFYELFILALRREKPLTITPGEIEEMLVGLQDVNIVGFYKSLYDLQN